MTERRRTLHDRASEPPEPAAEQCSAGTALPSGGVACWYPQIGGYAGKAVVMTDDDGCADVWVWHDGQFPFRSLDDADDGPPRSPVLLHHCDGGGFIRFGQLLERLAGGGSHD